MKRRALAVWYESFNIGVRTYVLWGIPEAPNRHIVKEYPGQWPLSYFQEPAPRTPQADPAPETETQ